MEIFERIKKAVYGFFRAYPELLSVPAALVVWWVSIHVLRWFDPTSGVFDAGVFQIIIFTVIQFFVYLSIAWLAYRMLFGTPATYLKTDYKKEFKELTAWQRITFSYGLFAVLLCVLAYLSNSLHA